MEEKEEKQIEEFATQEEAEQAAANEGTPSEDEE